MKNYLETEGLKFNPYYPYVAKNIIEGVSITIVFHVDDAKAKHKGERVVETFEQWIDFMYEYPNIGKVK